METATWIGAIATSIAAMAAVTAVLVAYFQLNNLNATLRMNALTAVLQLEADMNARKQRVDELSAQIRKEGIKQQPNSDLLEILKDELDGYIENWINSADRLAYCILRGYLSERDWRAEYRPYFADLIATHEAKFRADSAYVNIVDLNNKWKRE